MIAAALLAFFLGVFGAHNFYMGYTARAVIQLCLTVLSLGFLSPITWIWSFVEFILILVRSGSYAYDANGVPMV
ncbi:TM2 domain-containing protein [Actinomyces sp. B33]|nr:TM2 domain-containing protein [Actinomyces sp. B33]